MNHLKNRLVCTVLLVLGWSASVHGQAKRDIIWRRGNAPMVAGEIKSATPDYISIQTDKELENIATDAISKLSLSDDPSGLAAVRGFIQNGQLKQAQEELASVKPSGRRFVQQDIEFQKAVIATNLALQGSGDVKVAVKQVSRFLKQNADSFRYFQACELMGDLAINLQRFDKAAEFYGKIGYSKSKTLAARGRLLQGDAWLAQGESRKAETLYQQVSQVTDPRLQNLGKIGLARCLAENGNASEAITKLEQIIKNNDSSDHELFARTYNALGDAYQRSGQKEAALDAYLHTDMLFSQNQQTHAEALFNLARLWSLVNKPAEASRARDTLKQRYAASLWAKK